MVDMSIIDENEIDVVALQKELGELREENQSLRQENARLKDKEKLFKLWSQDIDNLYLIVYGEDNEENELTKLWKLIKLFSTKKGKLFLKFLV